MPDGVDLSCLLGERLGWEPGLLTPLKFNVYPDMKLARGL